jgi:hypothetical protein
MDVSHASEKVEKTNGSIFRSNLHFNGSFLCITEEGERSADIVDHCVDATSQEDRRPLSATDRQ